jgi:hypothetical protein
MIIEPDTTEYLRLARNPLDPQSMSPFKYRILTPALVSVMPSIPRSLLPGDIKLHPLQTSDETDELIFRFTLVNSLFTWGAAIYLLLFLYALGFSPVYGLLGAMSYLTLNFTMLYNPLPMADASAQFFLIAGFFYIHQKRWSVVFLLILIGYFSKEIVGPLLSAAWVLDQREKLIKTVTIASIPTFIYILARILFPASVAHFNQSSNLIQTFQLMFIELHLFNRRFYFEFFIRTFLWLGPFAAITCLRYRSQIPPFLRKQWIFVVLVCMQFCLASDTGRLFFLAFPVLLPLGLIGLRELIEYNSNDPQTLRTQ